MAFVIPTTAQIAAANKANLESSLSQDTPPVDIAFLNVLSLIEAFSTTGLYKYATDRAKGNLAITASESDLELIGEEFEVPRKSAESAVLTISLPAADGTVIAQTISFIGDSNGVRYFPDAPATATLGVAILTVTAEPTGVVGNLNIGEKMSISVQVAGAETIATITVIDNIGADIENLEIYRQRVLFAERGSSGGGNATDYKKWSEVVAGVKRAYPFSGKPVTDLTTSYPADRTVYIEATTDINVDGIPPQSLLDEVRESINNDPDTAESLPPLGLEDSTLYVEPIIRTEIYVTITGLTISTGLIADAKDDLYTAISTNLLSLKPFVDGIDFEQERNDLITGITLSSVVNSVLVAYGGSAKTVKLGTEAGSFITEYGLNQNELVKNGGIEYD